MSKFGYVFSEFGDLLLVSYYAWLTVNVLTLAAALTYSSTGSIMTTLYNHTTKF